MPSGDNYMDFHLDYPQSQGAMIMIADDENGGRKLVAK